MRTVELSDHPGELLNAATRQREAAGRAKLSAHERQLRKLRRQRDDARHHHKWWTYLRLAFAISRHKRSRPLVISVPTDQEEMLRAGIAGERLIARELGAALDDEWTLLHGYRNGRGEIDHLLLGPTGLFAIEVKNINATVQVNGDTWVADKYDRYGNHVEQYTVADRRGRSPSQQLNQSANALASFLHQRGQPVPVRRVVVLSHPRARVGKHANLTVSVAVTAEEILRLVRDSPDSFGADKRKKILALIERDHAFHERH
ncbi:MAG: NERD domain-containing protein [Streptosporangiaceae bacterium]|nr:NERD domain-containing protein [Streptosporangiaceae bacterium]